MAQLMDHTNAHVTINVYTQVMDHSLREAVATVGSAPSESGARRPAQREDLAAPKTGQEREADERPCQ